MTFKAERLRPTWNELKRREAAGIYKDVDRLRPWILQGHNVETLREADPDVTASILITEPVEIYEVWFEYDIEPDGVVEKMVWWIHLDAEIALRKQYNWYPDQLDPYDVLAWESRPGKVYGFGFGKAVKPFQLEISTIHNQRLDNGTIKNMPVFKRKSNSLIPDRLHLKPGEAITVDAMEDIEPLFLGQPFDTTAENEQGILALLYQRVGMQDYTGQEGIANAQSTTALAMLTESGRRFDSNLDNVRMWLGKVLYKVLLLYQTYWPEGKAIRLQGDEGAVTEMIFHFPEEDLARGISVTVTATTSATSRELERINKVNLYGMLSQFYGQATQYLVQALNPQFPQPLRLVMLQVVSGLSVVIRDVLDDYNLQYANELVSSIEQFVQQAEAMASIVGGPEGASGMAAGPVAAGGAPAGGSVPDRRHRARR